MAKASEITCEVIEKCGVISDRGNGWKLELRYVSWNGKEPRYDLRPTKVDENTGKEISAKGITLSGEELEDLGKLIMKMAEEE